MFRTRSGLRGPGNAGAPDLWRTNSWLLLPGPLLPPPARSSESPTRLRPCAGAEWQARRRSGASACACALSSSASFPPRSCSTPSTGRERQRTAGGARRHNDAPLYPRFRASGSERFCAGGGRPKPFSPHRDSECKEIPNPESALGPGRGAECLRVYGEPQ